MPKHRTPLPPEIKELVRLIRLGHLFEVQKWIDEGRPVRLPTDGHFTVSPLQAAIRTGFHSMAEIFLNALGKEVNLDALLYEAVQMNRLDMVELLHRFGANPKAISYDAVVNAHDPLILRWFEDQGIDLEADHPLATAFQHMHRAALGTYMRWRDRMPQLKKQVDMALRFHARQGSMKWVCLLLWAGADPRAQVPSPGTRYSDDDGTAMHDAIFYERWAILEKFKIDPAKDDLDRLLYEACSSANRKIIEQLLALGADPTVTGLYSPVDRCIWILSCALEKDTSFSNHHRDVTDILCLFASKGAKWIPPEECSMKCFRRTLAKANPGAAIDTLIRLVRADFFDRSVFQELMSSPRMKELLGTGRPGVIQLREYAMFEEKKGRTRRQAQEPGFSEARHT